MERIITYDDIPFSEGQTIYLRSETDPKLFISLLTKGYKIIDNIRDDNHGAIYVTGRRQDYLYSRFLDYKEAVDAGIQEELRGRGIVKPRTVKLSFQDLFEHKYQLPFVLKNENQNGGREKFLISTEEDYDNLIDACRLLISKTAYHISHVDPVDDRYKVHYDKYLGENFTVQEYIQTPSEYNTTVRLLTSSSQDLLYGSLKYKEPETYADDTSLLGYLLSEIYPLSTKSIVSNTLRGGNNILLGEGNYPHLERALLNSHNIDSVEFQKVIQATKEVHAKYKSELGIICGFDYIYDREREKWFLLEYHSRPMVGDYSKRQGIEYTDKESKLKADGRVRATALALTLKKGKK